jgi:1,4-dihydroxy-6-naphthoate synthase
MLLTLAHSPDPDDAFMWWPITGKVQPDGTPQSGAASQPRIDTRGFRFQAVPADIEVLNRRAAAAGDLDITALSFRAWCDVQDRYVITRCGSSFGDGFGPKVVAGPKVSVEADLRRPDVRIAIPGRRTTAFLLLNMLLGADPAASSRVIEMPFDQIIGAVARGDVDAGVVIHEGQLLFEEAGLKLIADLGAWWKATAGLPAPLGCNAMRRDIDARFGKGAIATVSSLLKQSIEYALAHRAESIDYTMPFALANAAKKGAEASGRPTLERVDRYVAMYVNAWTVDMGDDGFESVRRLLTAGAAAGYCPKPERLEVV